MIRWDSAYGEAERRIAKEYSESSIYSVGSSEVEADEFLALCEQEKVTNAWRFITPLTNVTAKHIRSSPELFRYQVFSYNNHDV